MSAVRSWPRTGLCSPTSSPHGVLPRLAIDDRRRSSSGSTLTHQPCHHHCPSTRPSSSSATAAGGCSHGTARWTGERRRDSELFAPASDQPEGVTLGGYDLFNHFVWIHAMPPDLLIAEGDPDRPVKHTWLVRLEIQPVPRRRLRLRRSPKRRRLYPLQSESRTRRSHHGRPRRVRGR